MSLEFSIRKMVREFLRRGTVNRGLERRKALEEFFQIVLEAFDVGGTKIVQAPTGTGKTYSYLIPIIEKDQKAIISTGTKMLQEQLRKDLENFEKLCKIPFKQGC